jgi:hypothetical protein
VIGSLAVHIAAKLPIIRRYWLKKNSYDGSDRLVLEPHETAVTGGQDVPEVGAVPVGEPALAPRTAGLTGRVFDWIDSTPPAQPIVSRRGFVTTVGVTTAAVVTLTAGQSFRVLDALNLFAPRKQGYGPAGLPINRTAEAAKVLESAVSPGWRLTVARGSTVNTYSLAELRALPQAVEALPIACVEGWSQMATWRGVRLHDLMEGVGREPDEGLTLTSLEAEGGYRVTQMGPEYVQDDRTLVALELNGEALDLDHGYPARMIAPGRPGVLQTKWLSRIEVVR